VEVQTEASGGASGGANGGANGGEQRCEQRYFDSTIKEVAIAGSPGSKALKHLAQTLNHHF